MTQTIEIPEGFELKKVSDTEYKIVKKEKILPKTWEEFCEFYPIKSDEHSLGIGSAIITTVRERRLEIDRNVLPTKEKAEAILALCQLIQLRDCYNDGWKPDWKNENQYKYVFWFLKDNIKIGYLFCQPVLFAFKSEKLRDEFLNNFKDLIEKLRPLYE